MALKLVANNKNPKEPPMARKCAAIINRAIMTECAAASFFGEGVPENWPP